MIRDSFHLDILAQYLFLIPIVVGTLCESAKVVVTSFREHRLAYEQFLRAGGFPSSHSSFVTSLLIIVWYKTGLESVEFAMAAVFATLVWYDAMHSRREIGLQAEILNRLQTWRHFTTHLGHSFIEVLGGIGFGAAVTWIGILLSA